MKFLDSAWFKWVKAAAIMIGLSFAFMAIMVSIAWVTQYIDGIYLVMAVLFLAGTYVVHGSIK